MSSYEQTLWVVIGGGSVMLAMSLALAWHLRPPSWRRRKKGD
ncbi:MAG: hypothetical protein ACOY4K_07720 [Pseudomonadota bacterium]